MKRTIIQNMRRSLAAFVVLLTSAAAAFPANTPLAPFGQFSQQPWEAKTGSNYNDWYTFGYDDSSWQTVSGPISTADSLDYYNTEWPTNKNNYYLRRHFNVSSLDFDICALYVARHSSCTVYLYGRSIYNSNNDGSSASNYDKIYIAKELLNMGDNVLAVSVGSKYVNSKYVGWIDFGLYGEDISWTSVELASPGTLGQEVLYQVDMLADVEFLRVKGQMNADDWNTISNMANLKGADLSEAQFDAVPNRQFYNCSSFCYIKLPEGMKTIGEEAFSGCSLGSISIPASVTTIGKQAFYDNAFLATVQIPAASALTSIGDNAFYYCRRLRSITLPNGITELPNHVFYQCYSLTSVVLPQTLQSIGNACFYDCSIEAIDLPPTLTHIGSSAFYNNSMESLVLPMNLEYLGEDAFEYCRKLKTVELPATPSIQWSSSYYGYYQTFQDCTALEKVVCYSATPPRVYSNPFYGVDCSKVTLVVPAFAIVDYKLDDYWHDFGSITEGAEPPLLNIDGTLTLTNNRRPANKTDILLDEDARLTVGGNAPFEVGTLTFTCDLGGDDYGQLINHTTAMSTDQMVSRVYANSNRWYFITPLHDVNIADISHSEGDASFIFRRYNGQNRAAAGPTGSWQNLTSNTLKAGQGYILQTNKAGWLTMPATANGMAAALVADDVTTPLATYNAPNAADASWNYVANPYPCHYDIYYLDMAAPITVWDYSNRTYRTYSPIDDDYALYPMEAFFVQKPAAQSQLLFQKEGRQFTKEVQRPAAARRQTDTNRQLIDLLLTDGTITDRTRIVLNPMASTAYEAGADASKFFSSETDVPQLCTIDAEGNCLSINERPMANGTVALGIHATKPGTYTLSLGARTASQHVWLIDNEEHTQTLLVHPSSENGESGYTFTINESNASTHNRFMLLLGTATSINTAAASQQQEQPIYDLQGRPVSESRLQKGIYVKNGKKQVVK